MYGMWSTCVVHRFLRQKVVVSTKEHSYGMKRMYYHIFFKYTLLNPCMECIPENVKAEVKKDGAFVVDDF